MFYGLIKTLLNIQFNQRCNQRLHRGLICLDLFYLQRYSVLLKIL